MSIGPAPICLECQHFRPDAEGLACDAFPGRIPEPIILTDFVHRKPYPGDHGIQFEPRTELPAGDTDAIL